MDNRNDLYLFAKVVELGSFAAAAGRLILTPSGVSRRVSRLEDRLGCTLLKRSTRHLELTASGEVYYRHCRKIVEDIGAAEDAAREAGDTPTGALRVGVIAAFATRYLLPLLPKFQRMYPAVSLELMAEHPVSAGDGREPEVRIHSLDSQPGDPFMHAVCLGENPWIVCAAPAYLERTGTPVDPIDLRSHDCLLLESQGASHQHWGFIDADRVIQIPVSGPLTGYGDAIHQAALAGLGVARLAAFLVGPDIKSGKLVPLLEDRQLNSTRAIYATAFNPASNLLKTRVFLDFVAHEIGRHPQWI